MTFLCRLPSYKLREKQDFVQPNFFSPLRFVLISLNPTRFFKGWMQMRELTFGILSLKAECMYIVVWSKINVSIHNLL